jgi:hypothetical protein
MTTLYDYVMSNLAANVLKVHARLKIRDSATYPEAIGLLRDVSTMAADLADSLEDSLKTKTKEREN